VLSDAWTDGDGDDATRGVTALTALGFAAKKSASLLGDSVRAPVTLTAATRAYERLVELEERHAAAWAAKEETDGTCGALQAALDVRERAVARCGSADTRRRSRP
jgi:hypothetical protein